MIESMLHAKDSFKSIGLALVKDPTISKEIRSHLSTRRSGAKEMCYNYCRLRSCCTRDRLCSRYALPTTGVNSPIPQALNSMRTDSAGHACSTVNPLLHTKKVPLSGTMSLSGTSSPRVLLLTALPVEGLPDDGPYQFILHEGTCRQVPL